MSAEGTNLTDYLRRESESLGHREKGMLTSTKPAKTRSTPEEPDRRSPSTGGNSSWPDRTLGMKSSSISSSICEASFSRGNWKFFFHSYYSSMEKIEKEMVFNHFWV
ncbi:hypothetical protein ACOSQ3_014598 [Xanthoceras sorbifolium]